MQFNTKEKWIAFTLLGLPLALTLTLMFPHYERFTAPGHIVRIKDFGINGHVYMTYVEMGVTSNNLERLLIALRYRNEQVSFEPTSREAVKTIDETREEVEKYKEVVVSNALKVSGFSSDSSQSINSKYETIIEKAADYEGDSLGLMIAIGLVEEEYHQDFSRGGKYTIAGTGTMKPDGYVGSVGGIKEKLATAEKDGVDYFFVPKDKGIFFYDGLSNQEEADQYVKEHNVQFHIIPVETLEEALSFLKSLP